MPTDDDRVSTAKEQLNAITKELDRIYGRIEGHGDQTLNIIQYIILVFGVALVAASHRSEAIAAIPIFWTVWLLHSQVVDLNTLKYSIYARRLEEQANRLLEQPVYLWEQFMTARGNTRPIINNINFIYWGVLNGASWLISVFVYCYLGHEVLAMVLGATWVLTWGPAIRHSLQREELIGLVQHDLDSINQVREARSEPTQTLVPSESLKAHVPVVILAAVAVAVVAAFDATSETSTLAFGGAVTACAGALMFIDVRLIPLPLKRSGPHEGHADS